MAGIDATSRHRDTLPSISHLDLEHLKSEKHDFGRFSAMNSLHVGSQSLGSPTTVYSGPPPPYSSASSTAGSTYGLSGYVSPPQSATRRSIREEKESPIGRKSLPSIHEALGDKSISFPTPLSTTSQHPSHPSPSITTSQSLLDAPRGPSNPFSQPPSALRDTTYPGISQTTVPPPPDMQQHVHAPPPPPPTQASRKPTSQSFGYPGSPISNLQSLPRSSSITGSAFNQSEVRSPAQVELPRQAFTFSQPSSSIKPEFSRPLEPYPLGNISRFEEQRTTQSRILDESYGETVKRHLDVFDAEMGLNEINDAAARTLEFSQIWSQRHHQSNRTGYLQESLPSVHEIDDIMRQSHRIAENLTRLREVVITHQNALSEQRAHAQGSGVDEEYGGVSEDFKSGGFAGGDAKKRRGKAAPPGRCHSCNRAETPEWRRGPDGARTLCNACGLHYAKLTRKMGVNKAAAMPGSSLRPKNLDSRV